ncbi:MAG: M3 family oligoendopeptidase [Caldilineaceae bacterium]|nr:M3 family oligoendopeptidase [Caldilineaceae bacterium]
MNTLPHWDLTNVYPGLESAEFDAAVAEVGQQIETLKQFLAQHATESAVDVGEPLAQSIDLFNALYTLAHTVHSFIYSFVSTDSRNTTARKKMSEFNQLYAQAEILDTQWQTWVGKLGSRLEQAIATNPTAQAHAYYLRDMAEQAKYLMSEPEESLASELDLSGATAWQQLQRTVTSQISVDFELDGEMQKLPITKIINLHSHPDESVRRRAYEAENLAWDQAREPLAAALNGIKGTANTLDRRRGRTDALHSAIDAAHIDRATLEAMLGAMEASFPMFRRYFKAKAKHLGKEQLAWWDVFAPVGESNKRYSWDEARTFIVENFGKFSPELAAFARRAFDQQWMDAEPREGKVGGAFCMSLPAAKESRVLLNFDGSLSQVSTVAHELGHGYHNECLFAAGKTKIQSSTPMTLAETASIMCETIAMEAVLEQVQNPQEELAALEEILNGAGQVVVDIYSRYLFEKEVFERRAKAELSAEEFCEIMERAQKATYGDGLNPDYLQKYMWTWKPHYYRSGLSFYNFPYAFGLLFSTGLYAIYAQRGAAFVPDYTELLASTGEANAADLAARFGIDLRSRKFWEDSLAMIGKQVDRFCELA